MKKTILLILACMLAAMTILVPFAAPAEGYTEEEPPLLMSLTHNCKNTGRMLPEYFNPTVDCYILTVASWVSNPKFTMTANDPTYSITVNGQYVQQGVETQVAKMDDNPKQIDIRVSTPGGQYRDYTVFLQRRPSERRTKVSAGYINSIDFKDNKWYIDADLVSVTYQSGNVSTFTNKTVEHYNYACHENVTLYYGDIENAVRARNMNDFNNYCDHSAMYRFVYIEDEIVAVLPYKADY